MEKVIVTVLGKDQPGIVAQVTQVLLDNGCNLEDSSMTILEGDFAMLVIASLPESMNLQEIKEKFNVMNDAMNLCVEVRPFTENKSPSKQNGKNYILSVIGADKPGIVQNISQLLADNKVNITDVETKRIGTEGKRVYAMIIEVFIDESMNVKSLEEKISNLCKSLSVDMTFKPIDSLTF